MKLTQLLIRMKITTTTMYFYKKGLYKDKSNNTEYF